LLLVRVSGMANGSSALPPQMQAWVEARKRYHLSHAHVQMARELGLNPRKLGKIANHKQELWKAPLPQFIEHLYLKRFGRERPQSVLPVEKMARYRQLGQPQHYEAASRLSRAWSRPFGSDMSEGSGHKSRSERPQDAVYPEHQRLISGPAGEPGGQQFKLGRRQRGPVDDRHLAILPPPRLADGQQHPIGEYLPDGPDLAEAGVAKRRHMSVESGR